MIKEISIKNFKNVEDQTVVLDKYINSFVGENGSGKSTIIFKGPKIVLQNSNWPTSQITNGKSEATISIKLDNDTISRTRNKSTTSVTINDVDYDGKKNVQVDIEKFGFIPKSKKSPELHFLSSYDILDFMPKSAESFYTKISTVFGFNQIIDLKKEYSLQLKTTSKSIKTLEESITQDQVTKNCLISEIEKLEKKVDLQSKLDSVNQNLQNLASTFKYSLQLKEQTSRNLNKVLINSVENNLDCLEKIRIQCNSLSQKNSKLIILKKLVDNNKNVTRLLNLKSQSTNLFRVNQLLTKRLKEQKVCPTCKKPL